VPACGFRVEIDAKVTNTFDRLNCLVGDDDCFVGVGYKQSLELFEPNQMTSVLAAFR